MHAECSLKLLNIEDDIGVRRSITTYLEESGYLVYEAANGGEGLAIFREHQPDIVFTDLAMPNGNGLDLIPVLREESPHTPIVVISGTGNPGEAVEAMKLGAWDYIAKPICNLSILDDLLKKLINQAGELKEKQASLERLEQSFEEYQKYDAATGLPNRRLLADHFLRLSAANKSLSLILLDLDKFKMTTATFGHHAAEKVLREAATRIASLLSSEETAACMGNDVFAILTPLAAQDVGSLVSALQQGFHEPFAIGNEELHISASMGVVRWPSDGATIDELLKHADISVYQAKKNGRGSVQYYNPDFGARIRTHLEMKKSLRRALERDEFVLFYQPQVDAASGRLAGVETLLRWQRGEGGATLPSEFIPILEESGLIMPVGEWILKKACSQYVAWRKAGIPPFHLSVNISACQFHSGKLPEAVMTALTESGMEASSLCLELTESILMNDSQEAIRMLEELKALGVSLSIDDFGTGYSSLSYLGRMPISELKIDRSFVSALPHDQNNAAIVNTIISMAHCMNMRVVAEGVETEEQLHYLAGQGCQRMQGYYFSRPLTAQSFADLMTTGWGTGGTPLGACLA
jgi:diguanylate cyclase (GGDEF)-like protein